MATDVLMPQMGESIAEGTITKWLVRVGDPVERDQPLFEISTDKVDAEIPSPASGVLLEIHNQEGETVAVDQVVAVIGDAGEGVGAAPAEAAPQPAAAEAAAPDPVAAAPEPNAEPVVEEQPAALSDTPVDEAERLRTHSSPLVRKIAEQEGVDLAEVHGTGIHGRVTKDDIMAYLEAREAGTLPPAAEAAAPAPAAEEAPASAAVAAAAPAPAAVPARREVGDYYVAPYTDKDNVEIEPMSKIRQITAAHMAYSKATSAHVTTVFHIDMSRVAKARTRAKNGFFQANNTKLTYMPFIFKAVASALKAHRKVNASLDGTNIVYKKDINIGMAVALDRGLLVPVIRNADDLNLTGLARTANDLADRARSKKLGPDELQGGTFTVTNPGVFGSLFGTPVINQPQVAIMGIGAIEKRPVVDQDREGNDTIAIKTMSYFSITDDHRLVDGADADHFMNHVKDTLETDSWTELEAYY